MVRAASLTLVTLGLIVLGFLALAGVGISAFTAFAQTQAGRAAIAKTLVRLANDALAGHLELKGMTVLPNGALELNKFKVFDPEGVLVVAVDRLSVELDFAALARGDLTVGVALEAPTVLLDENEQGEPSLVRAFTTKTPAEKGASSSPGKFSRVTFRLNHLEVRSGTLYRRSADGPTLLIARDLSLDARGELEGNKAFAEVRAEGAFEEPISAPGSLELRFEKRGDALRLEVGKASLGATGIAITGEVDLQTKKGQVAVTRLAVDRSEARALAKAVGRGADLDAHGYAESDGKVVAAAISVSPAVGSGEAHLAAALRLDGSRALGLDVVLEHLDPSRLLASLPEGDVTATAEGALRGSSLDDLLGHLDAHVARCRISGVFVGPGDLHARADRGSYEVSRLALKAPGSSIDFSGRFLRGGSISGQASLRSDDLAALSLALGRILGKTAAPLRGTLRLTATLTGTTAVPEVSATLASPSLFVDRVLLTGMAGSLKASGPREAPSTSLEFRVDRVRRGGEDVLKRASLSASLQRGEATLSLSAEPAPFGESRFLGTGRGRLDTKRGTFSLDDFALSWLKERWSLTGPATISLEGPSVDRLDLASEEEHITLSGGLHPKKEPVLDARLEVFKFDVERLPAAFLPKGLGGRVGLRARATGSPSRPRVDAEFSVAEGRVAGLEHLTLSGDLGFDGGKRRLALTLFGARQAGGELKVNADVPVPLEGRRGEPIRIDLEASSLPIEEALRITRSEFPVSGKVDLEVKVSGTTESPELNGKIAVAQGSYKHFGPIDLTAELNAPATRVEVKADAALHGHPALHLEGKMPLDLGLLLDEPARWASLLRSSTLNASVSIPDFDLKNVAGMEWFPEDLSGVLAGRMELEGTPKAPRGSVTLSVKQLALPGYRDVSAQVQASLRADGIAASAEVSLAREKVFEATASLMASTEELTRRAALGAIPFRLKARVPGVDLSRATSPDAALKGTVLLDLEASGTLDEPELQLNFDGKALSVKGHPVGAVTSKMSYAKGQTHASLDLYPEHGGKLEFDATVDAALSLFKKAELDEAPLKARLVAKEVDLGFLPAVVPGRIRAASGKLNGEFTAQGPLSRPHPVGAMKVEGARIAVAEYGDYEDVAVDLEVTEDAVHLRRFEAHRGKGRLLASGEAQGLASDDAKVKAQLNLENFTLARAGMELAKLDLKADVTGDYKTDDLSILVRTNGRGTITLPSRAPRPLQSVDERTDIIVGPEKSLAQSTATATRKGEAFHAKVHLIVPGELLVKSDDPKIDLELKADATYEEEGGQGYATGSVEVLRGYAEPLGGRRFEVSRGKLSFTGGPPKAAALDIEAVWTSSQSIEVTVDIVGSVSDPQVTLSSKPSLDQSQIAILIATGRSDKVPGGSTTTSSSSSQDVGYAAAGAVVTQAFKSLIADKLPVESVSLDAKAVRAGTYLGRIYVGYVYRFDARIELGENQNEWSAEYSVGHGWTFESRYGDAGTGSASLIWSRNY